MTRFGDHQQRSDIEAKCLDDVIWGENRWRGGSSRSGGGGGAGKGDSEGGRDVAPGDPGKKLKMRKWGAASHDKAGGREGAVCLLQMWAL